MIPLPLAHWAVRSVSQPFSRSTTPSGISVTSFGEVASKLRRRKRGRRERRRKEGEEEEAGQEEEDRRGEERGRKGRKGGRKEEKKKGESRGCLRQVSIFGGVSAKRKK